MSQIIEFTEEQRELITKIIDEWEDRLTKMTFDPIKAKNALNMMYHLAGFKKPRIVIAKSPKKCNYLAKSYYISHHYIGLDENSNEIYEPLNQAFTDFINHEINEKIFKRHLSPFDGELELRISNMIFEKVGKRLINFDSLIHRYEKDNFRSFREGTILEYERMILCDISNALGRPIPEISWYRDLISAGIFYIQTFDNFCIISKPPILYENKENKKFHNTDGPVIKFEDGTGLYYIHGINLTSSEFEHFFSGQKAAPKDVLEIPNVELRAMVIKEYGLDYMLNKLRTKILDTQIQWSRQLQRNVENHLLEFQLNNRTLHAIEYTDHTTGKHSVELVPTEYNTCLAAEAWKYGISERKLQQIEFVYES